MSLHTGAVSTDHIEVTANASIDDLSAFTILCWIRFTANPSSRVIVTKGTGPDKEFRIATTSRPRLNVERATTQASAFASGAITLNTWTFFAATYDETDGPRIFSAIQTLGTHVTVAEVAYVSRAVGAGATVVDAGSNMIIGNTQAFTSPLPADIGRMAFFARRMEFNEIRRQQWRLVIDSDCRIYHEYWYPSGVADWSGNLNTGAVTGTTTASHVPVTTIFGHKSVSRGVQFGAAGGMMVPMHYWGSI